jgi:hypothetical protein
MIEKIINNITDVIGDKSVVVEFDNQTSSRIMFSIKIDVLINDAYMDRILGKIKAHFGKYYDNFSYLTATGMIGSEITLSIFPEYLEHLKIQNRIKILKELLV